MGENYPNLVTLFSIPFIISALVESIEKCTYAFQNVGDLEQKHKREKACLINAYILPGS
jgi:hypothetical protein